MSQENKGERRTAPGVLGAWMREGTLFPGKGGGFFWGDGGATRTLIENRQISGIRGAHGHSRCLVALVWLSKFLPESPRQASGSSSSGTGAHFRFISFLSSGATLTAIRSF